MKKHKTLWTSTMVFTIGVLVFLVKEVFPTEKPLSEGSVRPKVEYTNKNKKNIFRDNIETEETIKAQNQVNSLASNGDTNLMETPVVLPSLEVRGIIWGGDLSLVIINNEVLKIGDTIAGVKIKDINENGISVVFRGRFFKLEPLSKSQVGNLGKGQKELEGGSDEN